ncbi:MAG: hypothetical protein ACRC6B_04130, partial [Fusobacteriaceae bacterium]
TIAQSSRLINHFDNIEAAIEFGEGFEIDMSYFKTEIKIETVSEPEIKKELVEEKPQNDSQHKENSELIEILTMIQNKVNNLEISMLEKVKLKMKIAACTETDEIVNICIENKINL